jgi:hypothetical protein
MQAAVDGNYSHAFFGSAKAEKGYQKRLRAVVYNTLTNFKNEMNSKGQARIIVEDPTRYATLFHGQVSLPTYVNEVKDLMCRSRGRELPGTFNPSIIGELFAEQCQPWKGIAVRTMDSILQHVDRVVRVILSYIAAEDTADAIFSIISKSIDTLKDDLKCKVTELLDPHYNGHPITFNHYLTDNVQKAQSKRRRRNIKNALQKFFGTASIKEGGSVHDDVDLFKLLTLLDQHTEADMEVYASEQAVDYMQAYYKVGQLRRDDSS